MDIYDFLNMFNDLDGVKISVFDCDSTDEVFSCANGYDALDLMPDDLQSFEVESIDLFREQDGSMHMELNISMGEED